MKQSERILLCLLGAMLVTCLGVLEYQLLGSEFPLLAKWFFFALLVYLQYIQIINTLTDCK